VPDEIDLLRQFRDETPGPSTDAWLRARSAIEAARAEGQPALRRLRLRLGRPRLLAAMAIVASLVAVVLVASSGGPSAQQIQTMAYLTRIEHALAASGQANLVGYTRTVYSAGLYAEVVPGGLAIVPSTPDRAAAGPEWHVGSIVRLSYQNLALLSGYSSTGRLLFRQTVTAELGQPTTLAVIYADSTWWRSAGAIGPDRGHVRVRASCGAGAAIAAGGWPVFIRSQLRCGFYAMAGRQRVNGVNAIKITGTGTGPAGIKALWVNPKTYLPVRVVAATFQTDFRWAEPGPLTLAQLKLVVPAGFRQVKPPSPTDSP
jgi:hypothetical protein